MSYRPSGDCCQDASLGAGCIQGCPWLQGYTEDCAEEPNTNAGVYIISQGLQFFLGFLS